jgi:hypothetical protein
MHNVLLYAVSLWDILEIRMLEVIVAPRSQPISPFVLTSVSRRWSQFVTSSPQLWSHLLIDIDNDDALECLQLSLLLSRNTRLFIALSESSIACDAIVMDLLRVDDRIDTLVYPPNASRSSLAKFQSGLEAARYQHEPICLWYILEVQSVIWPQRHTNHYSFPTSIRSLRMDGLLPLANLVTLSPFQSLSFLSVGIGRDRGLSLGPESRLELPNLERLKLQMAFASHQRVQIPLVLICGKLKYLHLRRALELDLDNPQWDPSVWLKFEAVDALQELQIYLDIEAVTDVGSIHPLVERLQGEWLQQRQREWKQREQREPREMRSFLRLQQMQLRERLQQTVLGEGLMGQRADLMPQKSKLLQEQRQLRKDMDRVHFMTSLQTDWRQWLNLPDFLENVWQSSLEVTFSTRNGSNAFITDIIEESLLLEVPRLIEVSTSEILHIFPEHLQKLHLHGFRIPGLLSPTNLPNLVSLEIIAVTLNDLLIIRYIQMPQLRDLRVQTKKGSGELHKYDWRDITTNLLDCISLIVEIPIPHHKPGNHVPVFHLPRTRSLNISSPYVPLYLCLVEPAQLLYSLRAELDNSSAAWQDNLVTEWINPHHGIPGRAKFGKMMSLQRLVLENGQYTLGKPPPIDELFNFLTQNIHICPQLTSIAVAQCPSSWPNFLHQLGMRNRQAIFSRATKCIEELVFYQPLHATIIGWLMEAIKAKVFNITGRPPVRDGNAWPVRPFGKEKRVFRSCYVCHITGMELGCLKHNTQTVDCDRQRGVGLEIRIL